MIGSWIRHERYPFHHRSGHRLVYQQRSTASPSRRPIMRSAPPALQRTWLETGSDRNSGVALKDSADAD